MAKIASQKNANGARSSAVSSSQNQQNVQDEIAKVAYQLFLERGSEHGSDADDWYRAEQIVKQRRIGRN